MMKKITVSINIISLWRETLYKTLESISKQVVDFDYEINIILQGNIDRNKLSQNIYIYEYEKWLWFGYYRNEAIKKSNGEILVWIDDDEYTKNNNWLHEITFPIIENKYKVVTAGTDIELWKWYLTDCISYLWYPGWWAVWFSKMWSVFEDNTTHHLCSWNFAFHKEILEIIPWFREELKSGAEDVAFWTELSKNNIKIFYNQNATIWHISRSGVINFCNWHIWRGKSISEFKKLWLIGKWHINDKLKSIQHILFWKFFTIYMPGIWFMFFLQNICNIYWMIRWK